MVTPGLLPEASDRRSGAKRDVVVLAFLSLSGVLAFVAVQLGRVANERDRLADELYRVPLRPPLPAPAVAPPAEVEALRTRIAELEAELRKPPPTLPVEASPPPVRPFRVLPKEDAAERLTQGLHELRSARPVEAERFLLRALPEGFLPLVMTALLRGDVREAVVFLARAIASDPEWLRRFRPRDLFGAAEEYERARTAVEERTRENPLDPDAKVLLAYFLHHEKGPSYAKALLVEATTLQPDHPEAKAFLETLEKP